MKIFQKSIPTFLSSGTTHLLFGDSAQGSHRLPQLASSMGVGDLTQVSRVYMSAGHDFADLATSSVQFMLLIERE